MSAADGLLLVTGGFLLAVLWMDLIFDTQARGERDAVLPEPVLASVSDYYRRATTTSRPMSRLIAAAMVVQLGALIVSAVRGGGPALTALSVALGAAPIALAAARTVRNAVRLGRRDDGPAEQSRLARSVYRDHLLCFACMAAFVVVRLLSV
jgi:hypothetical protein